MDTRRTNRILLCSGAVLVLFSIKRHREHLLRAKQEYAEVVNVFETLVDVANERAPEIFLDQRLKDAIMSVEFRRIVNRY